MAHSERSNNFIQTLARIHRKRVFKVTQGRSRSLHSVFAATRAKRLGRQARRLDALMKMRPKFYCLNDDQGDHPDTWVRDRVREFLAEYYPDPSEFERQEDP